MNVTNVLIVDDNEDLAENVCEILDELDGHTVQCHLAASGAHAIATVSEHPFDAAVIDVHLPDTDGFALISELRARAPHLQIVVITGDAAIEGAIAAVREGAFAYVLKPFRGSDLMETVGRAIEKGRLLREREALRTELTRSEQRHREVVENVPAFVLALDHEGRIVLWNRRLEEVTGRSREEMIGRSGRELVDDTDVVRLSLKSGGERLVRWHTTRLVDEGQTVEVYAMGLDVTDEQEMLRRTLRVERLAAVGTLAAGLAHEVRNPLNSATLQLQVLERRLQRGKAEPEALRSVTRLVRDELERLERLVKDFLDFARPQTLALEAQELDPIVTSVVDLLRPEADAKGVTVDLTLGSSPARAEVDAGRMRQVLLNLVRNALEAIDGGGTITVTTSQTAGRLEVHVADTGAGFPDDLPIFDAFFTTKDGGTGLGLAIVHQLVTSHGGTVTVVSRPGRTVFTVGLPRVADR